MSIRPTVIHGAVLGASLLAALSVWTREKEPKALAQGDVTVWSGRGGDLTSIAYESKAKKVTIEAKRDAAGRYFVGAVEREAPHIGDAGVAGLPRPPVGFVSVGPAEKLADALAPLKALRALGKVADDRAAEFGLTDPEATVTVRLAGAEKKLLVGGSTPGGGDRYVRLAATGEVYVIKGEHLRSLESPDSLLIEREMHEWKDTEITQARVEAGGKTRALVRGGPEGKRFWADPGTPDANDETLGNWMSKLDRLRPTEFAAGALEGKQTLLRVAYVGKRELGYLELVKVPGGEKPAYYVQTERTRLYGKVLANLGEQVEQDLPNIVK